jgi:hypothetical protein
MHKGTTSRLVAAIAAIALVLGVAAPAAANSAYSTKVYYSGSTYIWSYAYIDSVSDSHGCGAYNSWTKIVNTTKNVTWIRDDAHFKSYGFGSLTISSSVSGTITGSEATLHWTNSNGAKGSYISGTVCGDFLIIYIGFETTGAAFYDGTVRTSATPWL